MICVAEIVSAHGIKGEVKLKSFTETPGGLAKFSPLFDEKQAREFHLAIRSQNGLMLIAGIKGLADRNAAEKLRGTRLYMPRAKLPGTKKGQFYFADLKGLKAVDETGAEIGVISDVMNFGAGDIVALQAGPREYMLPFKPPFVGDPDLDAGTVSVSIPPDYPFSEKKEKKQKMKKHLRPRKDGAEKEKAV